MSVTINDNAATRWIGVLGDLSQPDDVPELMQALAGRHGQALDLSFYDARTLPGEILEELIALTSAGVTVKIHAYHSYLLHHLSRLGLMSLSNLRATAPQAPEFRAVAIGGSADSLDKVLALVECLPPGNVSLFVAQHVLEDKPNLLDSLLKARTDYTVEMPQNMTDIMPGTIYVAPPGHHMKVAHGKVYLTRDRKINFARPAIDSLFQSVADEYGPHALAVLLCGYGRDGVDGLARIRARGGCALVENGADCCARAMPDTAVSEKAFDHLLSLPELRSFVASAVAGRSRSHSPALTALLLEAVFSRYGYDYRGYQASTIERRLENLYGALGAPDFFALQRDILSDPDAFERLFLELSINVTAFFRHPEQFLALREKILPYLDTFPHIKIWSAGCANGKEAFSLAMLLDEMGMLHKTQIFATDINPYQLEEGKNGLYPLEALDEGRANYAASGGHGQLENWMTLENGYVKVDTRLRKHVLFYQHSLVHDGPFNEFQLILCRNVMIYFHPALQARVVSLFAASLHADGFLMLAPSEGAVSGLDSARFTAYLGKEKVFRRQREGTPS